jgi:hypothetical protein
MKLIDVDSKATLENFIPLKKRLNLYREFLRKCNEHISGNKNDVNK